MTEEVLVTGKGHTTIPIQLRKKYKICPGSRLEAIDTGEGVLFKPKLGTLRFGWFWSEERYSERKSKSFLRSCEAHD